MSGSNAVLAPTPGAEKFGPLRGLYLTFIMKSFQKQLAYKFEYFVGVLNGLLFIFIFTSLWKAIYRDSAAAALDSDFDEKKMVAYAIYAMLIRISMTMEDNEIGRKVRSGAIAIDLIKPVNVFFMNMAENFGQTLFHWFTRAAPILVITLLLFDAPLPADLNNYWLGALAWVFGYLILFMLNFSVSMLAFWFMETFSFQLMKYGLLTLFGGAILPIDFFPEWLQPAILFIPFQYIFYVPTALFIGHIGGADAMKMIALQGVWVAILGFACYRMWRAGVKKLVVQGG